ncbi:BREX-1 system adenine-specific DNA-methyltransferase PglX [Prevotella jejuni]|uniref:BREX-1 system adenine-specific DNA-methyltransferase PglX n=1 Tax=Prevotella jejuni TaxID=1177574 RepID=UPI0028EBBFC3|nr:BREX-1 system adenine-specific DNA-methyltransferase PglX [Prevotella jejuni]
METGRIKKFATEARNKLKAGIAAKIVGLGFDREGNVPEYLQPQLVQGGTLWNGQLQTEEFYHQWQALYKRVQQKGIKEVYEEAAYTWFNRLVAIRILQKNSLIEPVLDYVDDVRTPRIVDEARMGRIPQMQERQQHLLKNLLDDDAKTTEQFAILVTAFCHDNPILYRCFGKISDYTEILLPNDILTEGGFVDMLNHTEFITDADFFSPELIGWLYQFYIAERKDEVFGKKGKFAADEIPAATQIFTPNWIVKYMVENTIGRIYLDKNPGAAAEFKPKWKYLVEPSTPTPKEVIYQYRELTELLVGDLACGSGHILNECFDLLYDLYIYEGYSRREAVENIFIHNLRGIDLDTRAKQLAIFALMLKACQKDANFADAHILPHVLSMPTPIPQEQVSDRLKEFFGEKPSRQVHQDLSAAFELMQKADSLGSIMKFDLTESTILAIRQTMDYWQNQSFVPDSVEEILPSMELILALTEKYAALVMNPPYMGSGNMNKVLSDYAKCNYEEGKVDLFSIFMLLAINRLEEQGKYGMINMHSWMFLQSFEPLRRVLVENYQIDNALHLGPHTFDELSGEVVQNVAFVVTNVKPLFGGSYYRLTEGNSCSEKQTLFFDSSIGENIFYVENQEDFIKIPGSTIAYWISSNQFNIIKSNPKLGEVCEPRAGLQTSDNNRFLRLWQEVDIHKIGFNLERSVALSSSYKWFPHNKGGEARKWYGNRDIIINFENDGEELKYWLEHNPKDPTTKSWSRNLRNYPLYFHEGITWGAMGNIINVRYTPQGSTFDTSGPMIFTDTLLMYVLGLTNSVVFDDFMKLFSQGLSKGSGHFSNVPFKCANQVDVENLVRCNVAISKLDWDSRETSWDFECNPLVSLHNEKVGQGDVDPSFSLSGYVEEFKHQWTERFNQLHQNEVELNRQFIGIYGLEDELTPDVPLDEITILQKGEISVVNNSIVWHEEVLIKQLISYAVGVWMGRYKLGKKGLHIAHPKPTGTELQAYEYGDRLVEIDDDGLIPMLPQNSPFEDNLSSRIPDFIRIAFGEDKLTENLNYIEQKLGMSIEQYVQKNFWKEHKKMYQNRPIYWLFSSKKGAFMCLAYMHRMDAYTAERVRSNYLLPYIEFLQNQTFELESRRATLSTAENRKLQNLQKVLEECREYHERLQVVAEKAINLDLDDGVVTNYALFDDVLAKLK